MKALLCLVVFVYLTAQIEYCEAAESKKFLGRNVCRYVEENMKYSMKRRVSRKCHHERKNCDDPNFPWLQCSEVKCQVSVKWVPRQYIKRTRRIQCCPGYTCYGRRCGKSSPWRYHFLLVRGCLKHTSCITLPQFTPKPCRKVRKVALQKNRFIYHLTTPPKTPAEGPVTETNLLDFVTMPVLNLTSKQVVGLTLKNPNERVWAGVYLGMAARNKKILNETLQPGNLKLFQNYSDHADLLDFYRKRQHTGGPADIFFKYPSQELDFKDIIKSDVWQQDQVFVEQRFAGLNPMSIRKLRLKDYLKRRSTFNPELDKAIQRAVGLKTNLLEMVKAKSVYILEYPLIHNLTNVRDITDINSTDRREMRSSRSPITIFVSVQNCHTKKYELKPVAIQTDYTKTSPVLTPADGPKWLLAKEEVQRADITHTEIIEHLLKTHLVMEPICVTVLRTLSIYHPLFQILKWHCRGTFMTNSLGLPSLIKPKGNMHRLFAIGHIGAIELLNKGYPEVSWDETDFEKSLKERGVDDTEKLPYFPYRDDGIIMWRLVRSFAREYVDLYYKNRWFVRGDRELQNFANELSADGIGRNGGMGMLKGFPRKILTKEQLVDTFARIVFIPVQHHAVNYPVAYYGAFVPNMATKLYDDPRVPSEEFGFHSLPQSHVASMQIALSMSLGSLRYDRLFDYSSEMKDKSARYIVKKYYRRLMGPILRKINGRNKQRLKAGHSTYPYFIPGWMPNSIHT